MALRTAGGLTVNISGGFTGYYGSFYSSVDQSVAANTAIAMAAETTADADGVTMELDGSSKKTEITFANAGTYNIQFSAQYHNTGGGGSGQTINIWFALNGTAIADSATKLVVPSNAPYVVAAWNFVTSLAAGDYIEIYWNTDNANIKLEHVPAASPVPAIPSVIITAQQVR